MIRCVDCIWHEQCQDNKPCENYTPFDEDCEQMIENERELFHKEWNKYVSEMK